MLNQIDIQQLIPSSVLDGAKAMLSNELLASASSALDDFAQNNPEIYRVWTETFVRTGMSATLSVLAEKAVTNYLRGKGYSDNTITNVVIMIKLLSAISMIKLDGNVYENIFNPATFEILHLVVGKYYQTTEKYTPMKDMLVRAKTNVFATMYAMMIKGQIDLNIDAGAIIDRAVALGGTSIISIGTNLAVRGGAKVLGAISNGMTSSVNCMYSMFPRARSCLNALPTPSLNCLRSASRRVNEAYELTEVLIPRHSRTSHY